MMIFVTAGGSALAELDYAYQNSGRAALLAHPLQPGPCPCLSSGSGADQGASSGRRDDSGARTESKVVPSEEGLTNTENHVRIEAGVASGPGCSYLVRENTLPLNRHHR